MTYETLEKMREFAGRVGDAGGDFVERRKQEIQLARHGGLIADRADIMVYDAVRDHLKQTGSQTFGPTEVATALADNCVEFMDWCDRRGKQAQHTVIRDFQKAIRRTLGQAA